MRGYFDEVGYPRIQITVQGLRESLTTDGRFHRADGTPLCSVPDYKPDTMFDGAVSLPAESALPLGLELIGRSEFVLGDGTLKSELIFLGHAALGRDPLKPVSILLNEGDDILIGARLLEGKRVTTDYGRGLVEVRPSRSP
jgi:predicted aspartyl protease